MTEHSRTDMGPGDRRARRSTFLRRWIGAKLLLNLHDVPDDVRRILDSSGIGHYETRTFADVLRTQPVRVALTAVGITLLLG